MGTKRCLLQLNMVQIHSCWHNYSPPVLPHPPFRESLSPIQCRVNQYSELTTAKQTTQTISQRKSAISIKSKLYLQFKCKTLSLSVGVCVCTLTKVCLSVGVVIFLCSIRLNGLSVFLDGAGQDK